jgi:hypothetical protein
MVAMRGMLSGRMSSEVESTPPFDPGPDFLREVALERVLATLFLDLHTRRHGYIEHAVPYLVTRKTMTGSRTVHAGSIRGFLPVHVSQFGSMYRASLDADVARVETQSRSGICPRHRGTPQIRPGEDVARRNLATSPAGSNMSATRRASWPSATGWRAFGCLDDVAERQVDSGSLTVNTTSSGIAIGSTYGASGIR